MEGGGPIPKPRSIFFGHARGNRSAHPTTDKTQKKGGGVSLRQQAPLKRRRFLAPHPPFNGQAGKHIVDTQPHFVLISGRTSAEYNVAVVDVVTYAINGVKSYHKNMITSHHSSSWTHSCLPFTDVGATGPTHCFRPPALTTPQGEVQLVVSNDEGDWLQSSAR